MTPPQFTRLKGNLFLEAYSVEGHTQRSLYSIHQAAELLGGTSHWTLRKHCSNGTIRTVRLGTRVFIHADELARVCVEGLPPLSIKKAA